MSKMQSWLCLLMNVALLMAVFGNNNAQQQKQQSVEMKEVNRFDRQAYVGTNVELECDLRNFYDAVIRWRKVVGRMSDESEELPDGRLVIFEVTKEDAGEYECFNPANEDKRRMRLVVLQANTNNNNNDNLKAAAQTGPKPKQTQTKYRREIEAQLGGSVELFCEWRDEPNMAWRKVNGEIGPHKTLYGAPENRLALYYLTEEDAGTYECIMPDGVTSKIILTVGAKKSGLNDDVFKPNSDPDYNNDYQLDNIQTVHSTQGSKATLVCDLSDYTPGGEINWRKIAGMLSYNSEIIENRLEIHDVTSDDSGIYECSSESLSSLKFHLIVKPNSESPPPPMPIVEEPARTPEETTTKSTTVEPEENNEIEDPVDSFVTKTIGAKFEIVCSLRVPSYDTITWEKLSGEIDYSRVTPYDNKLVFSNLQPKDAGIYQCKSYSTRSAHRTRLVVMDETFPKDPNTTILQADRRYEPRFQTYCRENEATCRNGQCISKQVLCDGRQDCADGSDENNCGVGNAGYSGKCQPNEKPCRSDGKCIPKIWFCDGERECADGSDEESCTGPSPGGGCRSYEFFCKNRNQCVYKSFLCDNERDCADSSDEMGCIEPKVTQPPIRELTVCLGATFRLECRATGFPVPFINWRLNWGHVCPEPRCFMVSDETGFGVLTVTDARWEDAGAYSCEAFSTKGREFAIPDAIVRIEQCHTTTTTTTTTRSIDVIMDDCYCHGHSETCTCSNFCYDCQHNTTGPHCEFCADGYTRDPTRPNDLTAYCYKEYIPPPIRITTTPRPITTTTTMHYIIEDCAEQCHNHSECTCNNLCYKCMDNTWGERCEKCLPGFEGDATRGTPYDCRPIPGYVRVERCIGNTYGEYCDQCLPGYTGDPRHGCHPIEHHNTGHYQERFQPFLAATTRSAIINGECNQYGTAQLIDGTCKCKPGVVGSLCDQCAPKFFHMVEQKSHKKGCVSCFCNGLEVDCKSSGLSYATVEAKFNGDAEIWKISDRFIENQYEVEVVDAGIEFNKLSEYPDVEMFFLVPSKFKGNKLGAYGGKLEFKLTVKDQQENAGELKPVEIRISGAHVNIVHKASDTPIEVNKETTIRVQLTEENFKRYGDNGRVDRDHLMMALSDIKIIMIRASYTTKQQSIRLSDFSLEVAMNGENQDSGSPAHMVEICECPSGYTGNSCENCSDGYARSGRGFYLGLCEPQ